MSFALHTLLSYSSYLVPGCTSANRKLHGLQKGLCPVLGKCCFFVVVIILWSICCNIKDALQVSGSSPENLKRSSGWSVNRTLCFVNISGCGQWAAGCMWAIHSNCVRVIYFPSGCFSSKGEWSSRYLQCRLITVSYRSWMCVSSSFKLCPSHLFPLLSCFSNKGEWSSRYLQCRLITVSYRSWML